MFFKILIINSSSNEEIKERAHSRQKTITETPGYSVTFIIAPVAFSL